MSYSQKDLDRLEKEWEKYNEIMYDYELNEAKKEARAEGLAEGRAAGIEEGRTEGRAEGRAEGIKEEKRNTVRIMYKNGANSDEISKLLSLPIEEVNEMLK